MASLLLMVCTGLGATEGISLGSGYGTAKIVPIRIGVQKTFDRHWQTESNWPIGGYWEGSVYQLQGRKGSDRQSHKSLTALAIAGAFQFERKTPFSIGWPYIELGIGLSWLSKKEIGGRELGIHFQFEDKIGIGIRFGEKREYDLSYKAIHFSNAYIGSVNHGINLQILTLGYWF